MEMTVLIYSKFLQFLFWLIHNAMHSYTSIQIVDWYNSTGGFTYRNRELRNAAIFASVLIIITTALPVGRLAREMTTVSPLKPPAKFARLSLMNNCKKFKTGSGT